MVTARSAARALVAVLAVASTVAACGGASATPSQRPVSPSPSLTPSRAPVPTADANGTLDALIDVGDGRRLHVLCGGEQPDGVPLLWLEAGLDGSIHNWASVNGPLRQRTRVCAYDRAGLGSSDRPPDGRRTVDDLVDDLEAVIAGAGIEGPMVIAAHSAGPWVSTVYAARHPDDVLGLVFIDPRGPAISREHLAALGAASSGEPRVVTEVRDAMTDGLFDDNAEQVDFGPSEAIVEDLLEADGPLFGDRPVVVLGATATIDQLPPLPEPYRADWWRIWQAGQRAYAAESTDGTFAEVQGSGHLMMDDRPRAVIDAISEVLEATSR